MVSVLFLANETKRRNIIEQKLFRAGYNVMTVSDMETAKKQLKQEHHFDIALMDLGNGRADCVKALAKTAKKKETPLIVLTDDSVLERKELETGRVQVLIEETDNRKKVKAIEKAGATCVLSGGLKALASLTSEIDKCVGV